MKPPDQTGGPEPTGAADPATGTIVQEAGRLLDALQEWMADHAAVAHGDAEQADGGRVTAGEHATPPKTTRQANGGARSRAKGSGGTAPGGKAPGARRAEGSGDAMAAAGVPDGEAGQDGPIRRQVCQVCPICQLAGLLDGVRPELLATLGETATTLLAALRAAVETQERQWVSRRSSGVERIDIE